MESILERPSSHSKVLDHTSLHLLPCGIQHDGPANIPGFFFLVDGQYPSSNPSCTSTTTITTTAESTENTSMTIDATVKATTIASAESSSSTTTSASNPTSQSTPETSFRGRTLKATVLKVPEGYVGSLYQPCDAAPTSSTTANSSAMDVDQDPEQDEEEKEYEAMLRGMQEERKTLRATHQFSEFSIWGHDDAPTPKNDKVLKAMQWIDIANVLHQPVC